MKRKQFCLLGVFFVMSAAWLVHADDPTSKYLPLSPLASSLPAGTGVAVQMEVWDQATGGTMIFSEAHTVDTDAGSNISNDTGKDDLLLGRPVGLVTGNFPAGSSRYLDVKQGGVSVLPARVPLYASAFSIAGPSEVTGNLSMVDSTPTAGNILKGGALFLHNFGTDNTFIGKNAGNLTTSGFGLNAAIGASALRNNTSGGANTASGAFALAVNTTGTSNTASGFQALATNTTGNWNVASGINALLNNTGGSNNTAIGSRADVSMGNLTNATAIGADAIVNASNKIRLGNTAVTVVEGPPYNTVSDKTKKENFQPVDGEQVLSKIGGLSVTSWNYIGHDPKQFRHYGPVAQEFFAAFGHDGIGTIGTPTTISSTDMAGILMIAVQALEKRTRELDALKADNAELKANNAELKARLEKLERLVNGTQTTRSGSTE